MSKKLNSLFRNDLFVDVSAVGAIFCTIVAAIVFVFISNDTYQRWFIGGAISVYAFLISLAALNFRSVQTDELLKESEKRFVEQSERDMFFSLLDLHSKKVERIYLQKITTIDTKVYRGLEALKLLVHICGDSVMSGFYNDEYIDKDHPTRHRDLGVDRKTDYEVDEEKKAIARDNFINASSEFRVKKIAENYETFYDKHGHIVSHYFRNMYYALLHIHGCNNNQAFSKIFRAQLSRYELALLFYNVMGGYTSDKFNWLVFHYDLLDSLHIKDTCYYIGDKGYRELLEEDIATRIVMKPDDSGLNLLNIDKTKLRMGL